MSLTYNYLNLPATANKSGTSLAYAYNAAGQKLAKTYNGSIRNYINGIEYNGNTIDVIHTEEGLARNNGSGDYSYEYNLADHLGNNRVSFYKNPTSQQVEILQRDDYYAFGLRKNSQFGNNKYLYNGKELQEELGQYDYGARFYDPVVGRWNVIDRLSEYHFNTNPYHYVLNNPLKYIDPFGLDTVRTNQIVPPTPGVRPFNPAVDVIQLEGATVQGKSKDNDNSNTGLTLALVGLGVGEAENKLFNKGTWYSLRAMKSYSQKFQGNQYEWTKGISKYGSKTLKWTSRGLAVYGFYSVHDDYENGTIQYNGKTLSKDWRNVEYTSNTISLLPGVGAGWGIGWEVGRTIAGSPDYRKNIRPLLQDFLGVERDEYNQNSRIQDRLNNLK